jgi:hypothetical protein
MSGSFNGSNCEWDSASLSVTTLLGCGGRAGESGGTVTMIAGCVKCLSEP